MPLPTPFAPKAARRIFARLDVTDPAQAQAVVADTEARLGAIDVIVANAGIAHRVPLAALTDEKWDHTFDVDLKGIFRVVRPALPGMIARGSGAVVALSSIMGVAYGWDEHVHYSAAKSGVVGLVRGLAVELARSGVRVNGVAPGLHPHRPAPVEGTLARPGRSRSRRFLHSHGPPRRTRGHCRRDPFPRLARRPLHDRPDDRRRWRPSGRQVLSDGIAADRPAVTCSARRDRSGGVVPAAPRSGGKFDARPVTRRRFGGRAARRAMAGRAARRSRA